MNFKFFLKKLENFGWWYLHLTHTWRGLKFDNDSRKITGTIARITEPILGLFVLIWMHHFILTLAWEWTIWTLKFFEKVCQFQHVFCTEYIHIQIPPDPLRGSRITQYPCGYCKSRYHRGYYEGTRHLLRA